MCVLSAPPKEMMGSLMRCCVDFVPSRSDLAGESSSMLQTGIWWDLSVLCAGIDVIKMTVSVDEE